MIVISFYTDDKFLAYAKLLQKSLEKHKVKHDIERLPDLGSHRRNVHQKTLFIKRKLDEHLKDDVLWIDADATVRLPIGPFFRDFSQRYDVGAHMHFFAGQKDHWMIHPGIGGGYLCGGTLWFSQSDISRKVLDLWDVENKLHPDQRDQQNLLFTLGRHEGLRFASFPPAYCWVEPMMRMLYPDTAPVIFHFCVNGSRKEIQDGRRQEG